MSRSSVHEAPFTGPKWWVAGLWLLGALLVQTTIGHVLAVRGVEPAFVLVVVVWYAIRVDSVRAALYGLIAGALEDALATHTGGAFTISTTLVAVIAGALSRGFFADSLPLVALLVAVATLLRNGIFWTVMALQGYPGGLAMMHARQTIGEAILNVLLVLAAMLVVRRIDNQFG